MNYLKQYIHLIRKARKRQDLSGYYEVHHIIPKCLLKDKPKPVWNGKWNKVKLTAKEHFIAHLLLWKGAKKINHPCTVKLLYAVRQFLYRKATKNTPTTRITSIIYEQLRTEFSKAHKPSYWKGRKHSKKSKQKMSISMKGRISAWKGKSASIETRKLQSQKAEIRHNVIYTVIYKDGKKLKIKNLTKFARDNHYNRYCLFHLYNGRIKSHKDILSIE